MTIIFSTLTTCFVKCLYIGQGIPEWTLKNLWKIAFKTFEVIWYA